MPTAVFVLPTGSPAAQLGWASLFAAAANDELVVFYADPAGNPPSTGKSSAAFLVENVADSGVAKHVSLDDEALITPITRAVRLDGHNVAQAVQSAVEELAVTCLLIPRERGEKVDEEAFRDRREILQRVSCMVVQLCAGVTQPEQCERILVGAGPGEATDDALQWAARIAKRVDGQALAVYVERDSSDLAMHVARRAIKRIVADSVKQFPDRVDATVINEKDVTVGLRQAAEGHQLVLLGASHHNVLHRWLFSSISEKLMGDHEGPTVAMVRPALTWSNRVSQAVARFVADTIPQLDRTKRLNLFERIQGASQWNFDFAALISLSTLIATLGLLQDSAAVVIGAMLVAPLMTPLLGIGLAITQGNSTLGRTSTRTVALGFVCSYVMGWITASCVPGVVITGEVAARGSPGVIDLLVAFLSGVAAAYAIGRPNLLSALPGVAIAAALVPPVASSAIGFSQQQWGLAWGACLLFLTNIVAIVLGAAFSFWLSGIRVLHSHGGLAHWSRPVAMGLLAVALGLAVFESLPSDRALRQLRQEASKTMQQLPGGKLERLAVHRRPEGPVVRMVVGAPQPIPTPTFQHLQAQAAGAYPRAAEIEIEYRQVWRKLRPTPDDG